MARRVTLIDDDLNILTSVSMVLETEGFSVRRHSDAQAGLQDLLDFPPDLVVLDIKMPRLDGLELLRRLRRRSSLPVIFLTSKDQESDELAGLREGADDYITKPFSLDLLIQRVRAVLRRSDKSTKIMSSNSEDGALVTRGQLTLDPARYLCKWDGKKISVTVTEFLLIEALVKHPGHVKSRDQLLDAGYDHDTFVDDRTIDSHIKRIRKKFKVVDPAFSQIETLYGVGYRFVEAKT
ncbi:MAG: DNA-binding response regulator [Rhodospirillaceae bacterium]|nr:DNA-binding response regulator [Rhodospirillaceae bacterium]